MVTKPGKTGAGGTAPPGPGVVTAAPWAKKGGARPGVPVAPPVVRRMQRSTAVLGGGGRGKGKGAVEGGLASTTRFKLRWRRTYRARARVSSAECSPSAPRPAAMRGMR